MSIALVAVSLAGCEPPERVTRLGTFTPHTVNGTVHYTDQQIANEAKAVHAHYERVHQVIGKPLSSEVAVLNREGVLAHLTIKASAGTATVPPRAPEELKTFSRRLGDLLDEYPTQLLAVENEETVDRFFAGTPDDYLTELRAATTVAHGHAVPVTNGAIDRLPMALTTWNHIRLTRGTVDADLFLQTAFDSSRATVAGLYGIPPSEPDPYSRVASDVARRWQESEYLLANYGTDAGDVPIDYVNFHWYVSDAQGFRSTGAYTDGDALIDVVDTVRELTGKEAVTNEIGQWGMTPDAVTTFLDILQNQLRLPWVFWFDADGMPARALHNFDPNHYIAGDLRENGRAFAAFIMDGAPPQ